MVEESLEDTTFNAKTDDGQGNGIFVCRITAKRTWDKRRKCLLIRSGECLPLKLDFSNTEICPIGLHVSLMRIESTTQPDGTKSVFNFIKFTFDFDKKNTMDIYTTCTFLNFHAQFENVCRR